MGFRYPVTLDLEERHCVVFGGGESAEDKVKGLLDAGAAVSVVAASVTPGLAELAAAGVLVHEARDYMAGDLDGAFLAIAATGDRLLNARIHVEARRGRVLLNAVDDVASCDFAAPAIVRRGDLAIAVSTAGKAPALARRLREQLSAEFGPEWATLVDVLAEARLAAGQRSADFATWAQRWSQALDQDLAGLIRSGDRAGAVEAVRQVLVGEGVAGGAGGGSEGGGGSVAIVGAGEAAPGATGGGSVAIVGAGEAAPGATGGGSVAIVGAGEAAPGATGGGSVAIVGAGEAAPGATGGGSVAIVGAGPGDPGLITVRGKALLDAADVVVYDRLVHPSLWAGKTAIDAGKEPGGHRVDQEETNALLVRLAQEGQNVVRLKGGDPFVFGRGAEEADALRAAGVPYQIVSAPTSAIAALAAAGIPVTDRRAASSVAFVTGHCTTGAVDWRALATSVDTLVILMGLGHLGEIVEQLLKGGRPATTPAAVVANGTLPDQRVVVTTLGELPAAVAAEAIRPPAIVVVGEVVLLR